RGQQVAILAPEHSAQNLTQHTQKGMLQESLAGQVSDRLQLCVDGQHLVVLCLGQVVNKLAAKTRLADTTLANQQTALPGGDPAPGAGQLLFAVDEVPRRNHAAEVERRRAEAVLPVSRMELYVGNGRCVPVTLSQLGGKFTAVPPALLRV